jgi:hypothetical protein
LEEIKDKKIKQILAKMVEFNVEKRISLQEVLEELGVGMYENQLKTARSISTSTQLLEITCKRWAVKWGKNMHRGGLG